MNWLHCLLDILILTFGLFCYHPYDNTIVIAPSNILVVVYVTNTQTTLLTVCATWLAVTHALANFHYSPSRPGVMH